MSDPTRPTLGVDLREVAELADDTSNFSYKDIKFEDWISLIILWFTGLIVFLQFFTRYALNNSQAWTEEISVYLLMILTFFGSSLAVRRNTHIHIEFFYSFMGARLARVMSTVVDILRVGMFGFLTYLCSLISERMGTQYMIYFDWIPLSVIYWSCTAGCAILTLRAAQLAVTHWRQGWSLLTRPGGQREIG